MMDNQGGRKTRVKVIKKWHGNGKGGITAGTNCIVVPRYCIKFRGITAVVVM